MKNRKVMAILLFIVVFITACNKDKGALTNENQDAVISAGMIRAQINGLPAEELSDAEFNWILHMRQEEKLARDVYMYMYSKWNTRIFNTISYSEQVHMDAIKMLITKYGLTDPVVSDSPGDFTGTEFRQLYSALIQQGSSGILPAYIVGAAIEDLDLNDLNDAIAEADNEDIRLVFENLAKGSRNHLRSFCKNIANAGAVYTPQYISPSEFEAIISSPMETGGW